MVKVEFCNRTFSSLILVSAFIKLLKSNKGFELENTHELINMVAF